MKYLGVTLDHKLSWNTHVTNKTAQATNVLCSVRRTLGSTWGLAPRLTLWAYKALVLPISGVPGYFSALGEHSIGAPPPM